jgi:hypothetical protein
MDDDVETPDGGSIEGKILSIAIKINERLRILWE